MSGFIDVHGHLGEYGPFWVPRGSAAELVRRMDDLGVERLALSSQMAFASDYSLGNDQAAAAARGHPGRIFFYAVANPRYPDEMASELDRLVARDGFAGVKLHPSVHGCALESSGYEEVWTWATRHRCLVLTHFWVGDPFCGPGNVRKVAARYPDVQIILAHLGGFENVRQEILALAAECPNLWFDTSGSRHPRGLIAALVAVGLAGRLLYGSDMPFVDPGGQLGKVLHADVPESSRTAIMGGNARRLFGWQE